MKIAVCVKQVPENSSMKLDPVSHTLVREASDSILNQADFFAAELALQLKEAAGAHLEVLTMGAPAAESVLREVIAMGADSGTLITGESFAGSDTYGTSAVLAAALRASGGADVIFCGSRSSDGDTGQTGAFLAAQLGIPYFSRVVSIEPEDSGVILIRRTEAGEETIWTKTPVLVSVLEDSNHPRYATLERLIYSLDADIRTLGNELIPSPEAVGIGPYSPTRVAEACGAETARECTFLTEETTEDLVSALESCLIEAGCPVNR